MFTSSPRQKTTVSRSPSPLLTLNLGRAAYSTTWRYWAVAAVFVGVVAADGAANVVFVVVVVVVVVGDNNSKYDNDLNNKKGGLLSP